MKVPFYDIPAQHAELAESIESEVVAILRRGSYIMGANHNALEAEVAARHGVKHGIAVHSGTDALRILMDAAGIGPGDEVITTAFTFVASTETIVQTGARPVFVDIETETFGIDPAAVEAAITPRTKAILPVHLFGQLSRIAEIRAIADRHGLMLLEDSAQAFDNTFEGTSTGNFGLGAGFSFYVTKNLGAAGDGGLIITNDDEIAARCRSIRIHGMGRERYYYDHLGYTGRLDEIQAAVLVRKLTRLADWNARRAEIAAAYQVALRDSGLHLPSVRAGNNHTWHQFAVLTPDRDALQRHLTEAGVASMIYYPVPLHFHAPYERFGSGAGSLPVTERVCREVLNLPIHPHLSPEQVETVVAAVRSFAPVAA